MRNGLMVLCLLLSSVTSAVGQVSIHIGLPQVNIGINLSAYPQFVRVPGYPVYYAPRLKSNFFFYDGLYWVYRNDNWYASYWYNGPWGLVARAAVPLFILRIPVRYYRERPQHFSGWRVDAPPRWGELWGNEWQQSRSGWDRWNRSAVPAPAPLPIYQRQYSGSRYPTLEQQPALQSRNYSYQPRETVARQFYQEQGVQRTPATLAPAAPVVRQPGPARVAPAAPTVRQPAPQPRVVPQQPIARQEPRAVQQPPQPRAVQQPPQPRAVQQPQQPKAVQQPQQPRAVQQPQQPKAVQQPQQPKAVQQPQQPQQPKAVQQPQQPRAVQQSQGPKAAKEPKEGKEPKGGK
jgi:hypothetical protein